MVSAKPTSRFTKPLLELVDVDPNELILPIGGNVRKDTRLDPDFLASIKSRGVLVPVMVYPDEDGADNVFDGQRRTLGAVAAGQKTIPAIRAASRADADRIADQLTVNDHRASLTDAEHVDAFHDMALFGLKPSDIAKRTSTPVGRVDMALAVANNEIASGALQAYPITLEQAAAIAELSDDKKAVTALTEAAAKSPERFEHILSSERGRVALAKDVAIHEAQLQLEGIQLIEGAQSYTREHTIGDIDWQRIDYWALAASPTVELTLADVRDLGDDVAGAVFTDYARTEPDFYARVAKTVYFIANPEKHGIVKKEREQEPERELTPDEIEAEDERRLARAAKEQRAADWSAATAIRRTWISEYLERPTLPTDTIIYIAWARTYEMYSQDLTDEMLGWLDILTSDDTENEESAREALRARPKLALPLTVAFAFANLEALTKDALTAWNNDEFIEPVTFHLEQLRNWGYGLSDAEQNYITNGALTLAAAAAAEATEETDDDEWEDPTESEDD